MQKSLNFAFSCLPFFCSKLYFIITQKVNFFYELNIFKNYVFAPESKLSKVQFQKCCSDNQTWKIGGRNSNFSDVPIEFSNFSWNELIRENMIKFPLLSVLLLQFFVPYVEATFPGSCFNFEVHSTWVSRRSFTSRKKHYSYKKYG